MKRVFRFALVISLLAEVILLPSGYAARGAPAAGMRSVSYGTDSDDVQMVLGLPDADVFLQAGRGGNDTQYISGGDSGDWIDQLGGEGNDSQGILAGYGDDAHIFQAGGRGGDLLNTECGAEDDLCAQEGGPDSDRLLIVGGYGDDYIYQDGGSGGDSLDASGAVLYRQDVGGTTITVHGVEHGLVLGPDNAILYEW